AQYYVACFFFFSSRRRHTRSLRDWSSDVCSSDLIYFNYLFTLIWTADAAWWWIDKDGYERRARWISISVHAFMAFMFFNGAVVRSEERRVGKECRSRWAPAH